MVTAGVCVGADCCWAFTFGLDAPAPDEPPAPLKYSLVVTSVAGVAACPMSDLDHAPAPWPKMDDSPLKMPPKADPTLLVMEPPPAFWPPPMEPPEMG